MSLADDILTACECDERLPADPDWTVRGRFDWQAYVPDGVRRLWQRLDPAARAVAFVMATEEADRACPDWEME